MPMDKVRAARARAEDAWSFKLYIRGDTRKSREAISNLNAVCDKYFKDRCHIEVIDLEKHPELAAVDQIVAIPTLRVIVPPLLTKMIGDISHIEKVLIDLDLPLKK
jgi:circadian clock protein KaiB